MTVEREVLEETGLLVEVTGYVGVWVDVYADDPRDADADVINVAYYLAAPTGAEPGPIDPAEVLEIGWFGWDDLPARLAPPAAEPSTTSRSSGASMPSIAFRTSSTTS